MRRGTGESLFGFLHSIGVRIRCRSQADRQDEWCGMLIWMDIFGKQAAGIGTVESLW